MSFSLPVYAHVMARAYVKSGPSCAPQPSHGIDPRVLNYLHIDAIVDTSFRSHCSDSECSSHFGEIFERCSDDSMSS